MPIAPCGPRACRRRRTGRSPRPRRAAAGPARAGSLRSGRPRGLRPSANRTVTGRFSHTTRLASVSTAGDLGRRHLARQVDRRGGAQVKAHVTRLHQAVEGGRQHVLAGVLLHVIEAARPVDVPLHRARLQRAIHTWRIRPSSASTTSVTRAPPRRAGVERLPAGRRVERRPVEDDGRPAAVRLAPRTRGVELDGAVGVGVVEAIGHPRVSGRRRIRPGRLRQTRARGGGSCRSGRRGRRRQRVVAAVRQAIVEPQRRPLPDDVRLREAQQRGVDLQGAPSTPARVASAASRSNASMNSGRQSG
jgi:hypothetical protein